MYILFSMLFLNIVDDYYMQGILAKMKQKTWWNNQPYLYRNDWIIALIEHAFSWTFMILLPIAADIIIKGNLHNFYYLIAFAINMVIHAIVDNAKANLLKISLVTDQCIHIIQIIVTWLLYIINNLKL